MNIRGVPLWSVEDLNDARTPLAEVFSILLAGSLEVKERSEMVVGFFPGLG